MKYLYASSNTIHYPINSHYGAVAKSSAYGITGTGFASQYLLQLEWVYKGPMGRCKATTHSSSLTTVLLLTFCPRQMAQMITGVCAHDMHVL